MQQKTKRSSNGTSGNISRIQSIGNYHRWEASETRSRSFSCKSRKNPVAKQVAGSLDFSSRSFKRLAIFRRGIQLE
jgi:hypothetical protein